MMAVTDIYGFHVIREAINTADDVTKGKRISELVGNGVGDGKVLQSEGD